MNFRFFPDLRDILQLVTCTHHSDVVKENPTRSREQLEESRSDELKRS
jgi:hypothetical protein